MNWSTFLVNEFLEHCREAHEKPQLFHYAWLLILISLVAWREINETQFFDITHKPFIAPKYTNIWFTKVKGRHIQNNVTLFVYCDTIWHIIKKTAHMK